MTKTRLFLAVLAALLLGARLAAPTLIRSRLNASLSRLSPVYQGEVKKVRLSLLRGSIGFTDLAVSDPPRDARLAVDDIVLKISWLDLFRGRLTGAAALTRPRVALRVQRLETAPQEAAQKGQEAVPEKAARTPAPEKPLGVLLSELVPFKLDRFTIRGGKVEVAEKEGRYPPARVSELDLEVRGLTNKPEAGEASAARGELFARLADSGRASGRVKFDPTKAAPTFDMAFELKGLELASANALLHWKLGMDVAKGTLDLYTEATAADGGFQGYVKPFLKDLRMRGAHEGGGSGKAVKEMATDAAVSVLENKATKAVATKVPFQGRFDDPKVGTWQAVLSVLGNAFGQALRPRFEPLAGGPHELRQEPVAQGGQL